MMGDFRGTEILTFLDRFNLEPVPEFIRKFYENAYEIVYKNAITNFDKAVQLCEWALEELRELEESPQTYHADLFVLKEAIGRCHLLLACNYLNQEQELTKAREQYRQSEEVFRSIQASHLISLASFGLTITLRKQKRPWEEARNACAEAEERTKDESIPSNIPQIVIEDLRKAISKERLEIIAQKETVSPRTLSIFEIRYQNKIIGNLPLRPGDVSLLKATDFGKVSESKSRKYNAAETQEGDFVICFNGNFAPSGLLGKEILIREINSIEKVLKDEEIIFFIVEEDVKCVFVERKAFYNVKDSSDTELNHYYLRSVRNDDKDIIVLLPASNREKVMKQYSSRPLICKLASEIAILGVYVKTL